MRRAGLAIGPTLPWLAWRHLWSRPQYAAMSLLLLSLALTAASLLMQLTRQMPQRLERAMQGMELLVGPKGDPWRQTLSAIQLLNEPGGTLPYETVPLLRGLPQVSQAVPVLLGGRHRAFAVVGTEAPFLALRQAQLAQGRCFEHVMEVVLGADAAEGLGLSVGSEFSGLDAPGRGSAGGVGRASAIQKPFLVVGILARQGSALDGLILTDLSSLWAQRQPATPVAPSLSAGLNGVEGQPGSEAGEESLGDISHVLVSPAGEEALGLLLPWLNAQPHLQAAVPREEIGRMAAALGWLPMLLKTLLVLLLLCAWLAAFALMLQAQEQRRQDLVLLRVLGAPAGRVALLPLLEWLWLAALALLLAWGLSELAWMSLRHLAAPEQLHWLGTQGHGMQHGLLLGLLATLLATAGAAWPAWCGWRLQVSRMLQPGE
ncbi:ABC transporter permease [Roseateles sp. DB2]|uniref:ABC transporter permease n=1 Tax=Roseateles sp. DB2 TaxID=3453717 RepID=UPI003EEDBE71